MTAHELLSPAGYMEKLRAAILYGADAVYLAGRSFGMRSAADNFSVEELAQAADFVHARGKKLYLTVNTLPHEQEYPALREFLLAVRGIRIDALIVADLGVLALCRELLPDVELHISTQASVVTATSTMACTPKISPAASTAGSSAMTTLPISPRVVDASRICGEAVTIRRSSMGYLPPFRSSAMYQPLARPIVWLTGRLAGQA